MWPICRIGNPYLVILGTLLLFDNKCLELLLHSNMVDLNFRPISPNVTYFHLLAHIIGPFSPHVLQVVKMLVDQWFEPYESPKEIHADEDEHTPPD